MPEIVSELLRYLSADPRQERARPEERGTEEEIQTSQALVDRIVRAIELNQSVLLTGPRGCGKSWCVDEAIRQAQDRGLIPPGAKVFLQGNREIPRDYLAEDEIGFRTVEKDGKIEVLPVNRSAPLFTFARRVDDGGQPLINDPKKREVVMDFRGPDGGPVTNPRFVLFLDEVNRFSDGLLDSLLSVLEERKAVLAGEEYRLPVVVCMTMNPPGYDASARRLSPPLAARIGRSFSLKSPDLDTLSDVIVRSRIRELRRQHELNAESTPPDVFLPAFPRIDLLLVRQACLVTLVLWGRVESGRPSFEYLTPQTRRLLAELIREDRLLAVHMERLSGFCRFGPDGRAASDWLTAAVGLALDEAARLKQKTPELLPVHFLETARETLAHKLYEEFSAASHPELVRQKEESIQMIAAQVFKLRTFRRKIARQLDDPSASLWRRLASLDEPGRAAVREALVESQVTADPEVDKIAGILQTALSTDLEKGALRLQDRLKAEGLIEETLDDGQYVFTEPRYRRFFLAVAGALEKPDLHNFFKSFHSQEIPFREQLGQNEAVADVLGVDRFLALCKEAKLVRSAERRVADLLLEAWDLRHELRNGNLPAIAREASQQLSQAAESREREALRLLLCGIQDECQKRIREASGVFQGFLVTLLDLIFKRPLSPEAQRWKQYGEYAREVAAGIAP